MDAAHPPPQRVAASTWPLHRTAASRRIEAAALAAASGSLMERAGLATARLAIALAPHAQRVLVLAGPGNNGGDGLVAARCLQQAGRLVTVVHLADLARLPPDAATALQRARAAGVPFATALPPAAGRDTLVIDALLGLGSNRAPEGAIAAAMDATLGQEAPILAIDLPSGLEADTGRTPGSAMRARWTLSLLTLKPGLFTAEGRDHAGEVWFDPLGFGPSTEAPDAWLGAADRSPAPPLPRRHAQHKGSFGDVLVIGGAPGMRGALWLAARAALSAGAGRVYASALGDDSAADPSRPELMVLQAAWQWAPSRLAAATVVCGCGGGTGVASALPPLLAHAGLLVLDADALNVIASDSMLGALLESRGRRAQATVLTPHPLEAARLLATTTAEVQRDRLAAADALAGRYAAVVVLKGSGSVVARPQGRPWINGSGNALLATPGSGDVLAGWIGGCSAAFGRGNDGDERAWRAARHAVWLHGRAADLRATAGATTLAASELAEAMRAAG